MGALEWLLDAGSIYSYSYMTTPGNPVTSYALQLTGTGPTISDSGALFGLFLQLTPDSAPFAGALPLAGFGYPVPGGTFYSYADLSGPFRTTAAVPEPAAGLLMGTALALRVYLRRRRSEVAAR
jgi:hypothetical protein